MAELLFGGLWLGLSAGLIGNILFNPALAAYYRQAEPPDQAMIMAIVVAGMLGSVLVVVILLA